MPTKPPARRVLDTVRIARQWVEGTILWRIWLRMLENEFIDRSVALAAKAFVALLPMLVLIAAFTPDAVRTAILGTLQRRLGVEDDALALVREAFATPEATRSATGLVGLLLVLLYATSFTTALQRVFLRVWRRPLQGGPTNQARGLLWLAGLVSFMSLLGLIRRVLVGLPGTAAFLLISLLMSIMAWWATSWLMLRGDVRWRPLLASACLTAVATNLYAASASVWMPRTIRQNELQFGFFGVALALVTWLVGMGFIIVAATCTGVVLAEDGGRVGRLVRGPAASPLVPGAPPSMPPAVHPTLLSAFRDDGDVDSRGQPPS
jgi:membrane protein